MMALNPIDQLHRFTSFVLCCGLFTVSAAHGQTAPAYTAQQAQRGEAVFQQRCVLCHSDDLSGNNFGPPLKGQTFQQRWGGRSVHELFELTSTTMPPEQAGGLGDTTYVQLTAYLLQQNGIVAGQRELSGERAQLAAQLLPGAPARGRVRTDFGGPLTAGIELPPWPSKANPLDRYRAVTDRMLAAPDDSNWVTWRRTQDLQGYSPLEQINKKNVDELRVAWSLALPPGPNEMEPLVHDGVLFVHGYGDYVLALDAATGDELWRYQYPLPESARPSFKRNMALYGDKLYVGTSDIHVIALRVKTGELVWDRAIAGPNDGFMLTGGPLVARGKVMQGLTGIGIKGGAYIQALDADTGEPAWRFYSIPRPGEFGDDTWNGIPLQQRSGGSVWIAGSYDAELNLAYFGPAPTYETGELRK